MSNSMIHIDGPSSESWSNGLGHRLTRRGKKVPRASSKGPSPQARNASQSGEAELCRVLLHISRLVSRSCARRTTRGAYHGITIARPQLGNISLATLCAAIFLLCEAAAVLENVLISREPETAPRWVVGHFLAVKFPTDRGPRSAEHLRHGEAVRE